MAGTCRGLVERDKKGIWFIVTVAADNMQGRGRVTSSLRGNDLGDGVGLIWESVPTGGKTLAMPLDSAWVRWAIHIGPLSCMSTVRAHSYC